MICPGCQRDNRPARRYCGACGCNFAPACTSCGFANDRMDRFCGGCGVAMRAVDRAARPELTAVSAAVAPTAVAIAPAAGATPWDANELATLFAPMVAASAEAPDLPEVGIAQDDVDRLFGSPS